MTDFEFEPKSQRYRWKDSKRFISQETVENLREEAIAQSLLNAESATEKMIDGKITVDEWEREFAANIKIRTVQLYQLGKPGQLDSTDRGRLGNQIRFQYDKLWNFRNAIVNGDLSDEQIKYRANLYFNKTRWAYEEGRRRSHYQAGYMWERRIRQAVESCIECIAIANVGWTAINTLPRIGEACSCRANCKCRFIYSNSVVQPENTIQDTISQLELSWIIQAKNNMKITLTAPDIDASDEILNNAVVSAQAAFLKALSEEDNEEIKEEEIEKSPLNFGHPTEEQLEKMNRYRPKGSKLYTINEIISVPFLASNNLIHRSREVWSVGALESMSKQFPGKPFTVNHKWHDSEPIKGLVYDALLLKSDRIAESLLGSNEDYQINHDIFQRDGYVQLVLFVMFEANSSYVDKLYYRRGGNVSTGTFIDPKYLKCPLDGSYFGEGENSYECKEGHTMPNDFLIAWWYDEDELERLAPYIIIDRNTDAVELSEVLVGDLPLAKIL